MLENKNVQLSEDTQPFKGLTFYQLMNNPSGKYSSYLAKHEVVKDNLFARFQKLLSKYKRFSVKVYYTDAIGRFIFHVQVPSERKNVKPLFYDVIIEFTPQPNMPQGNLKNYSVKFFSNSPAFTFIYAYVANKNDLIPDWIKTKASNESLTVEPMNRNPVQIIGFEKSIYFAGKFLEVIGYLNPVASKAIAKQLNLKRILADVMDSNVKLKQYQIIEKLNKKDASKKKKKVKVNTANPSSHKVKSIKKAKIKVIKASVKHGKIKKKITSTKRKV